MVTLYQVAAAQNGIVVGTGNKVEDFGVGFYTKYGDGGVDIAPIADLMKSEVKSLSRSLGIDQRIIEAPPRDGLWDDDRTDETQLGLSYDELEDAMTNTESGNRQKYNSIRKIIYTKCCQFRCAKYLDLKINLNRRKSSRLFFL